MFKTCFVGRYLTGKAFSKKGLLQISNGDPSAEFDTVMVMEPTDPGHGLPNESNFHLDRVQTSSASSGPVSKSSSAVSRISSAALSCGPCKQVSQSTGLIAMIERLSRVGQDSGSFSPKSELST